MGKVTSVAGLLERYGAGEREFPGAALEGADLSGAGLAGVRLIDARLWYSDLSDADLSGAALVGARLNDARLSRAELSRANLSRADLAGASLVGTKFSEADLSDANLARADLAGANLAGARLARADLAGADLAGANLAGADLAGADLSDAKLARAQLPRARLVGANLAGANLLGTGLSGGDLSNANLSNSSLLGASLAGAKLARANLAGADLSGADLESVVLGRTGLTDLDLVPFLGTRDIKRLGSCTVDWRSIVRSCHDPRLRDFLVRTGMPPVFADYNIECAKALTMAERRNLLRSTFISHGTADAEFAVKLRDALADQGVSAFCFDAGGTRNRTCSHLAGAQRHDRVVLVCSEASLSRHGLGYGLGDMLAREAREGGVDILIPVSLDRFVFDGWNPEEPELKRALGHRVVADFSAWRDAERFTAALGHLLKALQKPGGAVRT